MTFEDLPDGSDVFLDANVFIYSYGGDLTFGEACTKLRERIEFRRVRGFISTSLFSEIAHRLMALEACQSFGWPYPGINRRLRRHPEQIAKLTLFQVALAEIVAIGVQILPIESRDVIDAADLSIKHGLLSGDAMLTAIMFRYGVTNLASNDADFDRVPGLTRYSPR